MKKYILTSIFLLFLFLNITCIYKCINENLKLNYNNNIVIEKQSRILDLEEKDKKEEMPENIEGYKVIAKLEIPKINLVTNILAQTNEKTLKISVTKFWGANPNEVGNFCVAGHNFGKDNMFKNVNKLKKGDKLFLADLSGIKLEYEIYDTFIVEPNDTRNLSQKTNGKREVTLITCTSDSKLRVIIKATEVKK